MKLNVISAFLVVGATAVWIEAGSATQPVPTTSLSPLPLNVSSPAPDIGYRTPALSSPYLTSPQPTIPQPVVNEADIAQQLSCMIQINSNFGGYSYDVPFTDNQTAAGLLSSTVLIDSAAARLGDTKLSSLRNQIQVQAYPIGAQLVRLNIFVTKGNSNFPPDATNQLLKAMCQSLVVAFDQSTKASNDAAQARIVSIQNQINATKDHLDNIHQQLLKARDVTGGSGGGFYGETENLIANLKQQKSNFESELARYQMRLDTIDPGPGPSGGEWEQVVKLREQRVNELMQAQKNNKATAAEVLEAQANLSEAKAQQAAAKNTRTNTPGNYNSNNGEISSLRSQIIETTDRLKPINEKLQKLANPQTRELFDRLPDLQQEEQRLRNSLMELNGRADSNHRAMRPMGGVTITVLDGK